MLRIFYKIFKKIIFYVLLLYSFNLIAAPIDLVIPINFITVSSLLFLGIPALFGFIFIFIVVF